MDSHQSDTISSGFRNNLRKTKQASDEHDDLPESHLQVLHMTLPSEISSWFQSDSSTNFDHTHTAFWTADSWKSYGPIFVKLFDRTLVTVANLSEGFLAAKIPPNETHKKHTRDQEWVHRMSHELAQHLIGQRFGNSFKYYEVAGPFLSAFFRAGYLSILVSRYKDELQRGDSGRGEAGGGHSASQTGRYTRNQDWHKVLDQSRNTMGYESSVSIYTPSPVKSYGGVSTFGLGFGQGRGYHDRHEPVQETQYRPLPDTSFASGCDVYHSPITAPDEHLFDTYTNDQADAFAVAAPTGFRFDSPLVDRILLIRFPSIDQADFYVPVGVAALLTEETPSLQNLKI
ncbi:hypothetical protein HYALB_00001732 [Hymenoscyphus albidus]|uniref:Uncharacterized protein n=1 Tax=Hymenoscyphus albidus TaxID=595503 RepID=A0A9N9Q231_9HELO|nr:hypothetical protein HYALB_00001732 [Hymenoscyphus albidus]